MPDASPIPANECVGAFRCLRRRLSLGPRARWKRLLACALIAAVAIAAGGASELAVAGGQPSGDRFEDQALSGQASSAGEHSASATGPGLARVGLSLGAVVVLIVATGWLYRRLFGQRQETGGAIALVSRTLLTPRHQVLVVRVGSRLLVVGDSGQAMSLLCDINDPDEVANLLGGQPIAGLDHVVPEGAAEKGAVKSLSGPGARTFERPPALDAAHTEIRALIERVRGLDPAPSKPTPTETAH